MKTQVLAPLQSGFEPDCQRVEIALTLQIPGIHIVGLPATEVSESRERIRSALLASGYEIPKKRVVVNLVPASVRKRGTSLDLPMALALLVATTPDQKGVQLSQKFLATGELGLQGEIHATGLESRALYSAWKEKAERFLFPNASLPEVHRTLATLQADGRFPWNPPVLIPCRYLKDAYQQLVQLGLPHASPISEIPAPSTIDEASATVPTELLPLSPLLEQMVLLSASGNHPILLLGPKGTGKTHTAHWIAQLTENLDPTTALERILIWDLRESLGSSENRKLRYRWVGAHCHPSALMGSFKGGLPFPGEASLAHGGVLLADEFPEWHRDTREALREPLESGKMTLTRASGSLQLPARFLFVATGNLCPCGGYPNKDPKHGCRCSLFERERYLRRLSGPILDRMDLAALVRSPKTGNRESLTVEAARQKIAHLRNEHRRRWGKPSGLLAAHELEALLKEHPIWCSMLDQLLPSNLRARHKILRVALSLWIYSEEGAMNMSHLEEAAQLRPEAFLNFS